MSAFRWYIPSFYGDINLEATDDGTTLVRFDHLTPAEKTALDALWRRGVAEGWTKAALASPLRLDVAIEVAQEAVARSLKPDRKQLSAVIFRDGSMEEVSRSTFAPTVEKAAQDAAEAKGLAQRALDWAKAAATVAAPRVHCPMPEFDRAGVRARDVLFAFLADEQREDFRRHNRFVSVGADTGHRYMISSRHALDRTYRRSLYDIDEEKVYCTRDWDVPAAEEMLALHLVVSLRGREEQARRLSAGVRMMMYCTQCHGYTNPDDWLYVGDDERPCECLDRS